VAEFVCFGVRRFIAAFVFPVVGFDRFSGAPLRRQKKTKKERNKSGDKSPHSKIRNELVALRSPFAGVEI
jgi:hypothetical protein